MLSADPEDVRFGRFRLDPRRRCLLHDGEPVPLAGRAFDVLCLLASARGAAVSKDELMARLWPGRTVAENNLHVHISALRKALDQHCEGDIYIITVPGRGYRVADLSGSQRPGSGEPLSSKPLPLPDKPSVAVLPFVNLSADPEQEYFSDGIANDIIASLSRYPSLLVIARNSSFSYKNVAVDVKRIGSELGVRYVLEGSVRAAGRRIRVTSELIEAETGSHLWAEHYDRELSDIFTVQDEIATAVTIAIAPAIADAELHRALRKPPESLDAWAAYQRGLWHLSKSTAADNILAEDFLLQATALDPNFAGSYGALAFAQLQSAGAFQRRPLEDAQALAEASARRAVGFDSADAEARSFLAWALWFRGDYEGARAEAERALAASPNLASAHGAFAVTLIFSGRPRQGLVALNTCIRLDPRDPILADRLNQIAVAFYFAGDYAAAIDAAQHAIRRFPGWPHPYRWLAAALGQAGRTDEAREALDKAVAVGAGTFEMYVRRRVPWHRPEDYEHMLDGLRKAGWKE